MHTKPLTAADAIEIYCDHKRIERDTWRALLDVDMRRKGAREAKAAAQDAHIAAEERTAAFLTSLGLDPEQVWS